MAMFRSLLQTALSDSYAQRGDGPSVVAFAGAALVMGVAALFLFNA